MEMLAEFSTFVGFQGDWQEFVRGQERVWGTEVPHWGPGVKAAWRKIWMYCRLYQNTMKNTKKMPKLKSTQCKHDQEKI